MPAHDPRPRAKEKERQCAYCDRTFTKEEHLNRHQRAHTGEKPFKCQKCYRKYSRSDVLARHIQTHHSELLGDGRSSLRARVDVLGTPLRTISTDILTVAGDQRTETNSDLPQEISQQTHYQGLETPRVPSGVDDSIGVHCTREPSPIQNIWRQTCGGSLDEVSQEQWNLNGPEIISNPQWNIMPDQRFLAAQSLNNATEEHNISLPPNQDHHEQQPRFAEADNDVVEPLVTGLDIDSFCHLRPGILNYVDFPLTPTPLSSRHTHELPETPKLLFTAEKVQRLGPLWGTHRAAPALRLCRTLWRTVIGHGADNIFSVPSTPSDDHAGHTTQRHYWGIDEQNRGRLTDFCEELVNGHSHQGDMGTFTGQSSQRSHPSTQSSPSEFAVAELPSKEVLNASIDFFFQAFHAPFVHKATFHASDTPCSLLLPICLVGFAALYRERSTGYVVHYVTRLMTFCHRDLTEKSLGRCQPWEVLSTIASALLVVYLALGFLEELDDGKAHRLCSQMLELAEKHGLFGADDADDLNSQLQVKAGGQDSYWKGWARAESIKRMVNYLIWLDMAYTRMVGTTGSVDVGKLDLHLPCEAVLFESSTPTRFFQLAQGGAQLTMPRMQIASFHTCGPLVLDSVSMQTLLSALLVQIATLRHKLPVGSPLIPDGPGTYLGINQLPGKESIIAGNIIPTLLFVPTKYAKIFQGRDVINALGWNNVCVALTADLTLLEVAFGREGLHAAHSAMVAVARWARTAAARRAVIHAAQMFEILSSARLSESNVARPDQMLYVSALVLIMYLFASDTKKENRADAPLVFELLQDIRLAWYRLRRACRSIRRPRAR